MFFLIQPLYCKSYLFLQLTTNKWPWKKGTVLYYDAQFLISFSYHSIF